MALMGWATHVLQWQLQRVAISWGGANLKKLSQFGLYSATRVHEVGIASNRGSACHGEYVLGSCTHRPSHHGNQFYPKVLRFRIQCKVDDRGEVVTR
ncbi:50S ribosomal protein L32 [Candidatus Hodgkinia cicadicola]|nr:50S ribosomal protein L32 [Candidatus Hodgkinia cicadicola]